MLVVELCVVSSRRSLILLLGTYSLCRGVAIFVAAPVWGNDSRTGYHRLLWLLRISAYGSPPQRFDIGSGDQPRALAAPQMADIRFKANTFETPVTPYCLWANLASHSKRSTAIGPGPVSVVLPPSHLRRRRFHPLPSIDAMLPFVGFPLRVTLACLACLVRGIWEKPGGGGRKDLDHEASPSLRGRAPNRGQTDFRAGRAQQRSHQSNIQNHATFCLSSPWSKGAITPSPSLSYLFLTAGDSGNSAPRPSLRTMLANAS